jgi:hypothetical protein
MEFDRHPVFEVHRIVTGHHRGQFALAHDELIGHGGVARQRLEVDAPSCCHGGTDRS